MAKENTPFHQLLIANGLTEEVVKTVLAEHEQAIKSATDSNADTITALEAKIEELSTKVEKTERFTPGTYKAKNKKKYKFRDGVLEFVFASNGSAAAEKFETKEALKNGALMEELIEIGAGFIEEVQSEVQS